MKTKILTKKTNENEISEIREILATNFIFILFMTKIDHSLSALDSKMCLVLYIPQGGPLPPEILAQSDLPTPEGCEF